MIVCQIAEASRYLGLGDGIDKAINWLLNNLERDFVKGTDVIGQCAAGEITVKCEEPALMPREKAALEAHKKFIDIHVPLKGPETIGWAPVSELKHVRVPYDAEKCGFLRRFGAGARTCKARADGCYVSRRCPCSQHRAR